MKINFRIIAKLCLLLVIIGFCMPMACDQNGFDLATGDWASGQLKAALWILFISAVIGLLLGVVLLLKKKIPVIVDWVIIAAGVVSAMIPFFYNMNDYGDFYQSGITLILVGLGLALVGQVVSLVNKEK